MKQVIMYGGVHVYVGFDEEIKWVILLDANDFKRG